MKVFLSHKMTGLNETEVFDIRKKAYLKIKKRYPNESIYIIDNYTHSDAPENSGRLWHLGKSIQQLSDADTIYFCPGWYRAKGCFVERIIAILYGIKIIKK